MIRFKLFRNVILFYISNGFSADCPLDWPTHGDGCYQVFEGGQWERSWNEAESYCNSFGGDLVDIQEWIANS